MLSNCNTKNYCKVSNVRVIHMPSNSTISERTYGSRYWAAFVTWVYLALFFPMLAITFCFSLIAYETFLLFHAIIKIILYSSFLLSFPTSIGYMWSSYKKQRYKQTYIISLLPILVCLIVSLVDRCFDLLFDR